MVSGRGLLVVRGSVNLCKLPKHIGLTFLRLHVLRRRKYKIYDR